MAMRTAWGYDMTEIKPLLSAEEFGEMTGGKYSQNPRTESALLAASQAIRNYCGWHICPEADCTAFLLGGSKIIALPATYVSEISSVTENGVELKPGQYEWRFDGLMRRCEFTNWSAAWSGVKVKYKAGFDIKAVPDLAEAVRSITEGVIAVSVGINSESADGVSISYRESASSVAAALTANHRYALEIYKVVTAHAS